MPRQSGPATLLRRGGRGSEDWKLLLTPRAPSTAAEGAVWLVVTYGGEIADDLVADVGPSLEYFLGRWPVLVADLAGAEDVAAAPPSLDVFDASEQLGGSGALFVDTAHLRSVGGDVTAAAALGMAERDEEAARDIHNLLTPFWSGFLQDRQIAVFWCEGGHAGQGWNLTELDRVDVLERVEIDDHAMLALRDLFRQKAVPVTRAWRAQHVFRFHAAAFQVLEIAGVISVSDHVLGGAAVAEVPGHRLHLHGMDVCPAVQDLAGSILADLFLLEVAGVAGSFEEGAGVARDIREDWNASPVLFGLALLDRRHRAVQFRKLRAFPASDISILGIIALDQNALAGPAANQRRLRAIGRHIAAACADEYDDRVGRAGAAKPLLAFLEPAVHAGGVEALPSSASMQTGWWYCPIGVSPFIRSDECS